MKKTVIISAIFAVLSLNFANSQTIKETRVIKTTAVEVYEKYSNLISKLSNGNAYNLDYFLDLFAENAVIYNDILPNNMPQEISPQEYFDFFTENIEMIYGDYSSFDLSFPALENGKWKVQCEFKKAIRFRTKKDFYYPKYEFMYKMTIEMDNEYNERYKIYKNAKITRIDVIEPLEGFFIVEKNNRYNLTYENETIDGWDEENNSRLFQTPNFNVNRIVVESGDYFNPPTLVKNEADNHFYDFKTIKKNLFGFGINCAPVGLGNKISSTNFSDIKSTNNALSLSLFYAWQLSHKQKSTWFLNLGLDLSLYNYNYKGDDYTEYQAIDADNDPYLRKIKITGLQEKAHNLGISLPLSFQYLYKISNSKKHPVFLSLLNLVLMRNILHINGITLILQPTTQDFTTITAA
ncbi:MAG: hypothetical protein LBJ17_07430 [Dysgonamonadaceae bacterium]|jgi:hypothetical protein|nr:hypothetical protein [Dysgonamonadaceae bacterium]